MIKPLTDLDVPDIARIHYEALKGDFLPSLGIDFLKSFYEGIIEKPGVYAFGFFQGTKLQGFVIGSNNSKDFFSQALKSRFLKLALLLLIQIIKKPTLIKKIIESYFYPGKTLGPKAELVVIAINKHFRGKGAGKFLVKALEKAFKKNGVTKYKLTVYADKAAVGFYEHLGYNRLSSFQLYGKMWYAYEKKLPKKPKSRLSNPTFN